MVRQLALAALVVGTLDIGEVILFYGLRGVAPIRVVQGVATGLYGRASFQGGPRTALINLLFAHVFCVGIPTALRARAKREPALQAA
jgi:hypothetical protein